MDVSASQSCGPRGLGVPLPFEIQLYAGTFRQVGDGFDEREVLQFAHQLDSVAAALTSETVVKAAIWRHAEGRCFLRVVGVGAQADEAGALAAEGCELRGDLDDIGSLPDLLDAAVGDPHVSDRSVAVSMYLCTNIPCPLVMRLSVMLL